MAPHNPALTNIEERTSKWHRNQVAVEGAIARREIRRTFPERVEILSARYKAHKAAGRHQAAAAVRRRFDALLIEWAASETLAEGCQ